MGDYQNGIYTKRIYIRELNGWGVDARILDTWDDSQKIMVVSGKFVSSATALMFKKWGTRFIGTDTPLIVLRKVYWNRYPVGWFNRQLERK